MIKSVEIREYYTLICTQMTVAEAVRIPVSKNRIQTITGCDQNTVNLPLQYINFLLNP